ncbi:MAG: universal stress protein [Thermoplasmata archaeon]
MFQKILVAFDGSEQGEHALTAAVELAKQFRSALTVLSIIPIQVVPFPGPIPVPRLTAEDVEAYRATVSARVEKIDRTGIGSVTTVILEGYVIEAIIEYLEQHAQDLVVVGARGLSAAGRLFLGSVSEAIVHHASCPVLVYRIKAHGKGPKSK